jgi:hypothetical protein
MLVPGQEFIGVHGDGDSLDGHTLTGPLSNA